MCLTIYCWVKYGVDTPSKRVKKYPNKKTPIPIYSYTPIPTLLQINICTQKALKYKDFI